VLSSRTRSTQSSSRPTAARMPARGTSFMWTFWEVRLDQPTGQQRRSEVRSIADRPHPRETSVDRLDSMALQVLECAVAGHCDLVRDRRDFCIGAVRRQSYARAAARIRPFARTRR